MTDVRIETNGNISWYWYESNAFTDWKNATVTELNAGLNMTNAISYNDTDFGIQASNTIDDPSFAAKGVTLTRGAAQYGGSISFYLPGEYDDITNSLSNTADVMGIQRHEGYVVVRNDGEHTWEDPWEAGDLYSIYKVMTAGEDLMITGEEAFRYTVSMLSRGQVGPYLVVDGTPAISVSLDDANAQLTTVGDKGLLEGTVEAGAQVRGYTKGLKYSSSDPTVVTVRAGVVVAVGVGSADITATYEPTGASDTVSYTIA